MVHSGLSQTLALATLTVAAPHRMKKGGPHTAEQMNVLLSKRFLFFCSQSLKDKKTQKTVYWYLEAVKKTCSYWSEWDVH